MSKDATENRLEEYADVFVDIFNNLILEGHGVLREEDISETKVGSGCYRSSILWG